jgi:hypothetical protein
MTREARSVEPGDLFVIGLAKVQSVVTMGATTYIAWEGETRPFDQIGAEDLVGNIIPRKCPQCGWPILGGDDE